MSLQWSPLAATEDVWHILDVTPNSPSDVAGLLPYGDYVIGSPEGLVRGESGLSELVEDVSFLPSPSFCFKYTNSSSTEAHGLCYALHFLLPDEHFNYCY